MPTDSTLAPDPDPDLRKAFHAAAQAVSTGSLNPLATSDKLRLYGLFAVARHASSSSSSLSPSPPSEAPSALLDPVAHAKWAAWRDAAAATAASPAHAMRSYIFLVDHLRTLHHSDPSARDRDAHGDGDGGFGNKMSTGFAIGDEPDNDDTDNDDTDDDDDDDHGPRATTRTPAHARKTAHPHDNAAELPDPDAICQAAAAGDLPLLHTLLHNTSTSARSGVHTDDGDGDGDGGSLVVARDTAGLTPLMRASDRGRSAVAAYLLALTRSGAANTGAAQSQTQAQLRAVDPDGMSALHYAAVCGHADVAGRLVAAGADVAQHDADGVSALDSAMDAATRGAMLAARDGAFVPCTLDAAETRLVACAAGGIGAAVVGAGARAGGVVGAAGCVAVCGAVVVAACAVVAAAWLPR